MLRGLLGEFCFVIAQGIGSAVKFAKAVLDGDRPGIPGVGPVTASAIVATAGDGHQFRNGREFVAWLGLTPIN